MTTVPPKKRPDPARGNEISEKLMENPELASLISELSTSADDASDLVKALLQASINADLQAEMDAHLGYGHSDQRPKPRLNLRTAAITATGRIPKPSTLVTSAVEVAVPTDRAGTFTPKMVPRASTPADRAR